MIIGHVQSTAISVLEQSNYSFYIGGSRRMAHRWQEKYADCCPFVENDCPRFTISITDDTDYDMYATYSADVEEFLLFHEFELSPANEYYLDSECVVIYSKDNVQVVLRKDAEFYRTVFENIDLEVYYNYLWKSSPTKPNRQLIGPIFNMLFDIAHATKGV